MSKRFIKILEELQLLWLSHKKEVNTLRNGAIPFCRRQTWFE